MHCWAAAHELHSVIQAQRSLPNATQNQHSELLDSYGVRR
jgi:hypothetical protein